MTATTSSNSTQIQRPWHPLLILTISLLCTPLPGGILHALNFGRLGLAPRIRPTLVSNLLLGLLITLISIKASLTSRGNFQIKILALFLTVMAAAYFYRTQIQLFRSFVSKGGLPGGWLQPCLFGILSVVVLLGVSFGVEQLQMKEFYRAGSLADSGQYREAEQIVLKYKQQDPRMVEAYYNLAIIYMRTDRKALAIKELKDLLRVDSRDSEAQELLQSLDTPGGEQSNPPNSQPSGGVGNLKN